MGLVTAIKEWWKSTEPEEQVRDYFGEPLECDTEETRKARSRFGDFVSSSFDFLGTDTASKLRRRALRYFDTGCGETDALRKTLKGNPFTNRPVPFGFVFDARYVESTESVISCVAAAYGIREVFAYDEEAETATPSRMFAKLKTWLVERGYELVFLDTGGDEYCGLFCPLDRVAALLAAAGEVGIALRTDLPTELNELYLGEDKKPS